MREQTEQTPGSFRDDEGRVIKSKPDDFKLRYKKAADAIRATITPERVQAALPSEDLRSVFQNIKTSTFSLFNLADWEKKRTVLEMREREMIDDELLKKYPAVYVGAGFDIEYPLALGARRIVMVDPMVRNADCLKRIKTALERVSGRAPVQDPEGNFNFDFDFGGGKERVSISLDPRAYVASGKPLGEYDGRPVERFVPPPQIGMLLAFQSADLADDPESLERLAPGGYVVSNRPLEEFFAEYLNQSGGYGKFSEASEGDKRTIVDAVYEKHGLESATLPFMKESFSWTVCRKEKAK